MVAALFQNGVSTGGYEKNRNVDMDIAYWYYRYHNSDYHFVCATICVCWTIWKRISRCLSSNYTCNEGYQMTIPTSYGMAKDEKHSLLRNSDIFFYNVLLIAAEPCSLYWVETLRASKEGLKHPQRHRHGPHLVPVASSTNNVGFLCRRLPFFISHHCGQ
jgi:hypothetical protein